MKQIFDYSSHWPDQLFDFFTIDSFLLNDIVTNFQGLLNYD